MLKVILSSFILLWMCQSSESNVCPLVPNCYCWISNATKIYCKNVTDITGIQILLKLYSNVYRLSISGSLTTLPGKVFNGAFIVVLAIQSPLMNISSDALDGITGLKIVNFRETLFTTIPKALAIPTIKTLQMNFGNLSEVEEQLQNMTLATDFLFSNNRIKYIAGGAFLSITNLQYLNLSFNQLTHLEVETFAHLNQLKSLDLMNNQLYTIDGCFKSASGLNPQVINLYGNNLTNIDNAFHKGMWAVKRLDLGGNPHLSLSESTFSGVMEYLFVLGLSDNELDYVDPYLLKGFSELREIYLNRNNLANIQSTFFSYSGQLDTVELSDNNLDSLEGLFPEMETNSLRYVSVDGNNLTSLNLSTAFEDVLVLDVSRNQIRNLRTLDLEHLSSVDVFNASGNPLSELESSSFECLRKIRVLDLSHSELTTLNQSIQHMPFLKSLIVSHSSLKSVDENEMIKLRWIKSINFRNNNLESVHGAFRNLSTVRAVDVSMNNLTTMTEDTFPPLTKRSIRFFKLWMADNPWSCDCRLLWLLDWLSHGCSLEDEPVCQSPARLHGRQIRSLNHSELEIWEDCPKLCTCFCMVDGINIFTIVNCTSVGLKEMPKTFPATSREIYLQDNEIKIFDGLNISMFNELHTINLEGNNLTKIRLVLPSTTRVLSLARNSLGRFPYDDWIHTSLKVISLSQNPWICDCESWNFRNWLASHNDSVSDLHDVRCGGTEKLLKNKVIVELEQNDLCPEESSSNTVLWIVLGVILAVICVSSYFFRMSIAAWLYSRGFKSLKRIEQNSYLYDAFLLYAEEDETFALSVIAKGLENESPKFDLCIPLRDVKSPRDEEKICAILPACNKVIAIFSRKFIGEYKCMQLLMSAMSFSLEDSSRNIIIIKHGELPPTDELDPTLAALVKSSPCLQWGKMLFWEKLVYFLPRKTTVQNQSFVEEHDDEPLLSHTPDS